MTVITIQLSARPWGRCLKEAQCAVQVRAIKGVVENPKAPAATRAIDGTLWMRLPY